MLVHANSTCLLSRLHTYTCIHENWKKHTNVGPYPFQMSRRNPGSHHDSKHIVRESSSIDAAVMKSNQYTQEIALGSAICLRCISNWKLVEIHGISYVHYIMSKHKIHHWNFSLTLSSPPVSLRVTSRQNYSTTYKVDPCHSKVELFHPL